MSAISAIVLPAKITEPSLYTCFQSQVCEEELQQMRTIAGYKIKHYRVTPQQGVLISSIFFTVIAAALGIALSPLAWIGAMVTLALGVYCFYKKDMQNERVRETERERLSRWQPIDFMQHPKDLATVIDYDLGSESSPEERIESYCLLNHLRQSYHELVTQKEQHEAFVNATVDEISKQPQDQAQRLKLTQVQELEQQRLAIKEREDRLFLKTSQLKQAKCAQEKMVHGSPSYHQANDTIDSLQDEIRSLKIEIEKARLVQRKKRSHLSCIDQQLGETLAPLQDWQYHALETIRKAYRLALSHLLSEHSAALQRMSA
jgi:hypothetical protein